MEVVSAAARVLWTGVGMALLAVDVSYGRTAHDLCEGWSGEMKGDSGLVLRRENIRLPHNWDDYFGMRGFRHGNLHGTATYQRVFKVGELGDRRSFIVFDGAGTYLTVRLNGKELCTHRPAGRLVSTVETTGIARVGDNLIEVICDHPSEIQDMPWHCGGCSGIGSEGPEPFGLFRKVRFETTDSVRIAPFGVHVWHDPDCSVAYVETEVTAGADAGHRRLSVACLELGIKGSVDLDVPSYGVVTNLMSFPIPNVEHWSPKHPKLYWFDVEIGDERERVCTGFATYRWPIPPYAKNKNNEEEHRFLLNGDPLFIHGACETDNRFGSNVAFDDEEIDARALEMKRMGINAWRDGHEPHDLRFNRHWDEDGVLWWPQFSTHTYFDTPEFRRNFLMALEQWVKERRNSPSIVLWGLQNESVILEDFARQCTELIHRMDPLSGPDGRAVVTCNYGVGADWNVIQNWSGCYGGDIRNYQIELARPIQLLNGEYGAWRVPGFHADPDRSFRKDDPWTEEHAAHVLWQKALRAWDAREHVCGHFMWTYFGHESPGRMRQHVDEGYRLIDKVGPLNPKGVYTLFGKRTVSWYMYRAYGEYLKNGTLDSVRYRPLSWYIKEGRRLAEPRKPSGLLQPNPACGGRYVFRLNCGGDEVVDSCGNKWSADSTAVSHSWSEDGDLQDASLKMNPVLGSQDVIDGPIVNAIAADAMLFGTYRYGRERLRFTFDAPPDSDCVVELYFIEPGSYGRVFDIAINDTVVQSKFDLGSMPERTVVRREYPLKTDSNGKITVTFPRVWCNQAVVSAIAIRTSGSWNVSQEPKIGYPASVGKTWRMLDGEVREKTLAEHLPPNKPMPAARVSPTKVSRTLVDGMSAATFLLRVASDYSVTMRIDGGDWKGKTVRWRLMNGEGCMASGVTPIPEAGGRFDIPLGTTINAGLYSFQYVCDGVSLSVREMK